MKYISQNNSIGANKSNNKRCFSANGFSLLPLALEQRLFCLVGIALGMAINLTLFGNATFALDSCLDSTTPCLNVSIANSISLDLKPISPTGTFAKSDTATNTVGVITNYFAGYVLGIAASSSGVDAANLLQTLGEGNEQTIVGRISSIGTVAGVTSAGITEQAFSSSSNTQYNNTWGYMLTKLNSSESTNYLPAPTTTAAITLDTTNIANPETANNYNIAIGARVDAEVPKGSYANTFVVQVVANPIPYEIAFDKGNAGEGEVSGLPAALNNSTMAESITLPNTKPTRSGYVFAGWCSVLPVVSGSTDSCSGDIYYQDGTGDRTFIINQTGSNTDITLYAMWQEVHNITFTAGNNIDTIIVADSGNNWKPFYITNGGSYTFSNAPVGRKYAVTVVPVANHTLDSWTSTSVSTNNLANPTLLTTTYTVGTTDETLTATGSANNASYITMQNIDLSIKDQNNPDESIYCPTTGINVTDFRDKKSYTVAMFGNYCYMLSNLRLDGGTVLDTATSHVSSEYTLPVDTGEDGWVNDYCKPYMASKNGEYYYNWPAATARTNDMVGASSCSNDTDNSVGDVCPMGWELPTYDSDVAPAILWDSGDNPGALTTAGCFYSGRQCYFGRDGKWSSRASYGASYMRNFNFTGVGVTLNLEFKSFGLSVRCMRSS